MASRKRTCPIPILLWNVALINFKHKITIIPKIFPLPKTVLPMILQHTPFPRWEYNPVFYDYMKNCKNPEISGFSFFLFNYGVPLSSLPVGITIIMNGWQKSSWLFLRLHPDAWQGPAELKTENSRTHTSIYG